MYAWRARVGLINPTHRGKAFAFWYNRVPAGVEIVPTFIGFRSSDRQTFEQGFDRAMQLAEDLKFAGCEIIAISGTPPVLLKGLDFEREFGDRLAQKVGLPVVTPNGAACACLSGHGHHARGNRELLRRRTERGDRALVSPLRYRCRAVRRLPLRRHRARFVHDLAAGARCHR